MNNTDNAIEVRQMSKDFKVVYDKPQTLKERLLSLGRKQKPELHHVLKNINVEIKKGETVALIGTNGSGKSTLLKLMTKILYPTQGELETSGKLTSLLELGAGFHPDFSGRENIYFNASIFGLTRKEIEERLDAIIEFSELEGFIDNPVRTYSSGMYMRLAFSIAINVDADILLIDEILAVGDQHFQDKCFAKLHELKESDTTIVIVSHDLNSIKKLCNRGIWIYRGVIKEDGLIGPVIDDYLEQVVIDHLATGEVITKTENYLGQMYIDSPIPNTVIHKPDELIIEGWELSETKLSKVKIFIDGVEIDNVERKKRLDVFAVFEGKYGGYNTNPLAGFIAYVDTKTLRSGIHKIDVMVYDEHDVMICNEASNFTLE